MSQRKRGAILILDLAVPRDFEPSIGELPNVYLYAVDDLQRVCQKNAAWRSMQYPKAEKIILEETERFVQGLQVRTTVPTIRRLREHADEIKNLEWQRLRGKLQQMGLMATSKERSSSRWNAWSTNCSIHRCSPFAKKPKIKVTRLCWTLSSDSLSSPID